MTAPLSPACATYSSCGRKAGRQSGSEPQAVARQYNEAQHAETAAKKGGGEASLYLHAKQIYKCHQILLAGESLVLMKAEVWHRPMQSVISASDTMRRT